MNACIAIPILLIIIVICEVSRRKDHQCGIPVQLWVEVFFIVALIYVLLTLNELWIIRCAPRSLLLWFIILVTIFLLAYTILTIWGYAIYFSDDNDC